MINIRYAKIEDSEEICNLIRAVLNDKSNREGYDNQRAVNSLIEKQTPENITQKLKKIPHIVAIIASNIVGVSALGGDNLDEIKRMYVHPEFQRRNIGSSMIAFFEKRVRELHKTKLVVYSNPNAVLFYENNGFKKIREIKSQINGFSYVDVYMEKELD